MAKVKNVAKRVLSKMPGWSTIRLVWYQLRLLPDAAAEYINPEKHYERRKKRWNQKWSNEIFAPAWMVDDVPTELDQALESGWFTPGGKLLDIGCGDGKVAHLLTQKGFTVYGFDFAEPAIDKAKKSYGASSNLTFDVHDVTQLPTPPHKFQMLFDRGCFHIIPEAFATKYVESIAAWAERGAKFLLIGAVNLGPRLESDKEHKALKEAGDHISEMFAGFFDIEKIEYTDIPRNFGGLQRESLPSLAVYMIRR